MKTDLGGGRQMEREREGEREREAKQCGRQAAIYRAVFNLNIPMMSQGVGGGGATDSWPRTSSAEF